MASLTKGQPKEMLPVGGKPMIFHAVVEAALSGLEEIGVVISEGKEALRRYLESGEWEHDLQREGQGGGLGPLRVTLVNQPAPLGSGDAVYRAKELVGDEPFALMMPDFILFGAQPALTQVISAYERFGGDIVGVLPLGSEEARGFGNVGIIEGTELEGGIVRVRRTSGKRESPLMVRDGETTMKGVGRWILGPHFFSYLERAKPQDTEWDDTPALQMICEERGVIGKVLEGKGFDVGNPVGYQGAHEFAGRELDRTSKRC